LIQWYRDVLAVVVVCRFCLVYPSFFVFERERAAPPFLCRFREFSFLEYS
jgi:hypothetical protein